MKPLHLGLVALCALAAAPPAWSHHSRAMFDDTKRSTLTGTIKQFDWNNPHVWIQLTVPDADGKLEDWGVEGQSTLSMGSVGWKRDTIKPGDKVVVVVAPRKDGGHQGGFVSMTLPDGKVMTNLNRGAAAF